MPGSQHTRWFPLTLIQRHASPEALEKAEIDVMAELPGSDQTFTSTESARLGPPASALGRTMPGKRRQAGS